MKQHAGKGATAKHAGTSKHGGRGAKHNPARQPKWTPQQQRQFAHWVAKHPQQAKPRQLTPGEVACCASQAVAASLELSGHGPVSDSAVLALHEHAGGSAERGASIWDALAACSEHGLDGAQPVSYGPVDLRGLHMFRMGTVLGVELPGSHAVTVAPDGCWLSWGEHYDPAEWPDAVIEEAWQVTWPACSAHHVTSGSLQGGELWQLGVTTRSACSTRPHPSAPAPPSPRRRRLRSCAGRPCPPTT